MDKLKSQNQTNDNSNSSRKDDYNFLLKGSKMDIMQPTKEDLQDMNNLKVKIIVNHDFLQKK